MLTRLYLRLLALSGVPLVIAGSPKRIRRDILPTFSGFHAFLGVALSLHFVALAEWGQNRILSDTPEKAELSARRGRKATDHWRA